MPDDQFLMTTPRVEICARQQYILAIRGSVGSHMFRHLPALVDGKHQDIVKAGKIACAYYASWILFHFRLIEEPHATVEGLVRDLLERSGWTRAPLDCRRLGAVLEWDKHQEADGEVHGHVGFCTGFYTAISHSDKTCYPDEHNILFGPSRKPIGVYVHPFLGEEDIQPAPHL